MPKTPKTPPTETEIVLKAARKALKVLENKRITTGIPRDREGLIKWAELSLVQPYSWQKEGQVRNSLAYHKIMQEAWQAQVAFVKRRVEELERLVELEQRGDEAHDWEYDA